MTTAPQRVVSVVNAKSKAGYSYLQAAVYELRPRKADKVLTYRRDYGLTPHRSERLAHADAVELAERLNIPFWEHVRQGTTAEDAVARHTVTA